MLRGVWSVVVVIFKIGLQIGEMVSGATWYLHRCLSIGPMILSQTFQGIEINLPGTVHLHLWSPLKYIHDHTRLVLLHVLHNNSVRTHCTKYNLEKIFSHLLGVY